MNHPAKRIWFGSEEPIFGALPANVLANFRNQRSENALLWNTIYKIAQPSVGLRSLLAIHPLWGTKGSFEESQDDILYPYFWGFNVQGERLRGLNEALRAVDGPGPGTEVDLILLGDHHLIAVEAKHTSGFGRCSRYQQGRCPEIHREGSDDQNCRYWEQEEAQLAGAIRMGDRPEVHSETPLCWRHYQLGRTLLLGQRLARQHERIFALWAIVPERGWRSLELDWLDFSGRVRDSETWRRMRVITWEGLGAID